MTRPSSYICKSGVAIGMFAAISGWSWAAEPGRAVGHEETSLVAEVRAGRTYVQMGQPVYVEFSIRNDSDQPVTLAVADLPVSQEPPVGMGLPLEHIFSGKTGESVAVHAENEARAARVASPPLPSEGRTIVVAPHGSVGAQLDLARYCDVLRRPGTFQILWSPYRGALQSNKLRLVVAPLRQATIHTDFGRMTLRFFYDEAPRHVENFIELAEKGFYDGLTFHRIVHGGLIQGGCPRGDGTGVRADGKLLDAELSDLPLDTGAVVMATARNAPDTGSSQFYICLSRLRSLEGKQTVFAHLYGEESYETLRKIGSVPTGEHDRPLKAVYIRNISLDNVPLDEEARLGGQRVGGATATQSAGRPGSTAASSADPSSGHRSPGSTTQPTTAPAVHDKRKPKGKRIGSR